MTARRPMVYAWATAIGALGLADWLLDRRHDGSTLSECARHVWHTDTPAGRVSFALSWAALSVWFIPHICRKRETALMHDTAGGG